MIMTTTSTRSKMTKTTKTTKAKATKAEKTKMKAMKAMKAKANMIVILMAFSPVLSKRRATLVRRSNADDANLTRHSRNTVDTTRPVTALLVLKCRPLADANADVECKVSCTGCSTELVTVSSLMRHFTDCAELKKKRIMPEHMEAIRKMRGQVNTESEKASITAREVLKGHKRRLQPNSNGVKPRKKSRYSDASSPTRARSKNPPVASYLVIDHEPNGCNIANTAGHAHLGFSLPSAPNVSMHTNLPPPQLDGPLIAQNNATADNRSLTFMSNTIDGLAMGFVNSRYSTVQDMDAATANSEVNAMAKESDMYTHTQYHTTQNSPTATDAPNTYLANNQYPTTEGTVPAMRGSSFMSNTMDGSFMYTDVQYPTTQNAAQSLESWRSA